CTFCFSSRRRHTRFKCDWSSDVCSSDLRSSGTGYRGRAALYEVMPIQGKLRRLIGGSTEDLFAAAAEGGMTTLRQDGIRLVREEIGRASCRERGWGQEGAGS